MNASIIKDIDDKRIIRYRNLKFTPPIHRQEKIFITEGEKVTTTLLKSHIEVLSLFALREYYERLGDLISSKRIPKGSLFTADRETMQQIVGYRLHQGIMAIGRQPGETPAEKLESPIVVMNGIINSENVGAIIRNAAAFGIDSILYDNETSSPWLRRAVRVSIGTILKMKYASTGDLPKTMLMLKSRGFKIIASEITDDAVSLGEFKFPEKYAVVLGTESKGIFPEILDKCDHTVMIPIDTAVNSINVAASSAIILYAASKDSK